MTYRNLLKKVFFVSTFLLSCVALPAQVMWNFKGGIMPITAQHVDKDDEYRLNWMAGLEIEIPLSKMLNFETGLRYKNEVLCFGEYDDNDVTNHLELPVRLTYKQKLGNNLSLHTGIGPYVDAITLVSGIEPSIVVNWKSLSFGVTYNNPCFYKGGYNGDIKINSGLMLTLGIRFHSRAWKYIGPGLLAAGAVAGTVYAATQGDNSGGNYAQNDNSYYEDDNSLDNSEHTHINNSTTNSTKKNRAKLDVDGMTYNNYDTQLSHMQSRTNGYQNGFDDKERIDIQNKMKSLREKSQKKGGRPITKSPREDWNGK